MNALTIGLLLALAFTVTLLVRSLFRQAGIQDAMKETSEGAADQLKLWEEFGQHLDESVALVDEHGAITYANTAFAELTQWPSRSSFHQPLASVLQFQNAEAKPVDIPEGEARGGLFVLGKDGRRTAVRAAKRPLHKPVDYSVVVLQNTTAENAEKELRHRLVNLSSFELRAPVTAMKGYASMILDGDAGKVSAEVSGYVKPILESTDTLLTIIDDMANVEELSTKKTAAKKKPMVVAAFLNEHSERLQAVAAKAERSLEVAEGGDAKAEIDPDQISRLLAMLVNTAARTAQAGTAVRLSVAESPRTIDIQLENQGSPLPKQSQANVFDYVGGRGLDEGIGFYVAKQIIESHHAYVTVNTKAEGNVFILSIPKLVPEPVAAPTNPDDAEAALAASATPRTGATASAPETAAASAAAPAAKGSAEPTTPADGAPPAAPAASGSPEQTAKKIAGDVAPAGSKD